MSERFLIVAMVRYTYYMGAYQSSYKSKLLYSRRVSSSSYKIVVWIIVFILFAGGIAYGANYLAKLSYWQITNISVSGTKSIQEGDVRIAIDDYTSGRFWRVIPKTNYFFVRTGTVENLLLEKFPRLRSVRVQKKFPSSLEVVLEERDIWALYCNDSLYAKEKSEDAGFAEASSTPSAAQDGSKKFARSCFYLDDTGVVIDSAIEYQGFLLPIFFERRTGNPALGEQVLSGADILFFNSAREEYKKNIGADIISFEKIDALPDDYILFFQEGWFVLTPRSADIPLSAKNIKTLLDAVIKDNRSRLLYIDARFGNKMFFKLKATAIGK